MSENGDPSITEPLAARPSTIPGIEGEGVGGAITPSDSPPTETPPAETTSRYQKKLERFGLLKSGDFNPEEIKIPNPERGSEDLPKKTLDSAYKEILKNIYYRTKEYANISGGQLTNEQKDFLKLFGQDETGDKFLETEQGWMLAQTLIDQEVFLLLADLDQQMKLDIIGHQKTDADKEISFDDLQGRINKFIEKYDLKTLQRMGIAGLLGAEGAFTSGAAAGFISRCPILTAVFATVGAIGYPAAIGAGEKILKSARRSGKIKLTDLTVDIDTTGLPKEFQGFIKYSAVKTSPEETSDFLFKTASAQLAFFEALGVDKVNLNKLTPWETLGLGTAGAPAGGAGEITQNLNTEWIKVRMRKFEELGGVTADTPVKKARIFFEANRETIKYFLGKHSQEIANGDSESVGQSIQEMEEKLHKLTDEQEIEKRKEKKQAELTAKEAELAAKQEELREINTRIEVLEKEEAINTAKQTNLNIERTTVDKRRIRFETALVSLKTQRTNETNDYNQQIRDITDPTLTALKATLQTNKTDTITTINNQINEKEKQIKTEEERIAEIDTELGELVQITAQLVILRKKRTSLESEITSTKTKGINKTIKRLKKEVEAGFSPQELALANKIRGAIIGCQRFADGEIMGTLAAAPANEVTVQDLTETVKEEEFDTDYQKGY